MRLDIGLMLLLTLAGCDGDQLVEGPAEAACAAGRTAATLTMDAGAPVERVWQLSSCVDLGDDLWRLDWRSVDWVLEIEGGPLIEGEVAASGVSVLLMDDVGGSWSGALATIDVQTLDGGPCGRWTTNPLRDAGGALLSIAPQPVGFDCTRAQ